MIRPWSRTLGLLLLLLPGLIALQDEGGAGLDRPFEFEQAAAPVKFPHSAHVNYQWMRSGVAEQPRDCRGCHDFDPADGIVQTSDTCTLCHYDFPGPQPSLVVSGTYDDRDGAGETFQHTDHLDLDCRACHTPPSDLPPAVPDDMYVPQGLGWCVNCHDPKSPKALPEAVSTKGQEGFQATINKAPRMKRNTDAVFKHSEHMAPGQINDPAQCARCHKSMERSTADIGSELFDPAACGDCHQDAASGALVFGLAARSFESPSDRSFYHSDHLGAGALEKSGEIRAKSCLACHAELKDEGRGVSDYELKWRPEDLYDACAKCHEDAGLTREGRTVAWKVADHGDVGELDENGEKRRESDRNDCGGCHLLGVEAPLKTARAERRSERSHPGVFDLKLQKHPHIIGPTAGKPQDCASCHLSQMDVAPSRIVRREFDHASHISKAPQVGECLDCHKMPAAGGTAFMEIANGEGRNLSYDEKGCASCHLGVERVSPTGWDITTEKILAFDHADHVKPGDAKSLDCSKCHLPVEADGRDYAYAEGVRDCSACHDHGEHPETTGNKDRAYVDGCAACHEAHVPGLPPVGVALSCGRGDIATIEGAQHHPLPRDRSCAACHLPQLTKAESVERPSAHLMSERAGYSDKKQFHSRELRQAPTPGHCFSCHFHNPRIIGEDATQAIIGGQVVDIRGKPYSRKDNVDQIRATLGKELRGYPGLKR